MFVKNVEATAQFRRIDCFARLALPPQLFHRAQCIAPRQLLQVGEQGISVVRVDAFGRKVIRKGSRFAGDGLWTRQEPGGQYPRRKRLIPPGHFVDQFVQTLDRREQSRSSCALDGVAAQFAYESAAGVVEAQVGRQHFGRAAVSGVRRRRLPPISHARVANHAIRQFTVQPESLPAERKVGSFTFSAGGAARGGHDLEAAVEQQRMDRKAAAGKFAGDGHFAHCFAGSGRQRVQRSERRSEVDAHFGPVGIEVRHIQRRQIGPERFEVHPGIGLRPIGGRGNMPFGVEHPRFGGSGPAEDAYSPR